jgi:hypothetical protein
LKGKELLFGDLEAIKLYSMRENLVVFITCTISYSFLFPVAGLEVVIMLIVFLYFYIKSIKFLSTRQYAWEQNNLMLNSHQRLNVEHPNNIKIRSRPLRAARYDHSKSINKSKYYENKDNFHQ